MSTTILKYALGADISKDEIAVCFKKMDLEQNVTITGARKFANTSKGISALVDWTNKRRKQNDVAFCVVMEATGIYHENAADNLYQAGFKVIVTLPSQSALYLKSLNNGQSKTDPIDAKGLAQMGLERKMRAWKPPNAQMRQVRNLTRQRESLQKMRTNTINRLKAHQKSAYSTPAVLEQLAQQVQFLEQQVQQCEQLVEQVLEQSGDFGQKIENIAASINGLGVVSLATVIAELDGCHLFSSQAQVVSFSGYNVIENQSGRYKGKTRISKQGNSHIRRILHFPALNVVRHHVQPFRALYDRVYERTKIKMKAYVAVQRKLLCLIYRLWKNDTVFDPNFEQKNMLKNLKHF